MTFEIMNAKKVKLTEEDIHRVAEIHTHPEISKWDKYYTHRRKSDAKNSICVFRKFFKRLPRDKGQLFLLANLDGKVVGFLAYIALTSRDAMLVTLASRSHTAHMHVHLIVPYKFEGLAHFR